MKNKYFLWLPCFFVVWGIFFVSLAEDLPSSTRLNMKEKIFITDRTGRKWDITHAIKVYNMEPEFFHFGIGVGAIPSVDRPVVVEKDNTAYPQSGSDFSVFGVNYNGEQRAYPVKDLARHEIFNETFPGNVDQYVSVAY